jgi:hypothetical protein
VVSALEEDLSSFCAGGGIGGGGVLVPLYILCLQFETAEAVALSNLTIAGGALANLMCNINKCVPHYMCISAAAQLRARCVMNILSCARCIVK